MLNKQEDAVTKSIAMNEGTCHRTRWTHEVYHYKRKATLSIFGDHRDETPKSNAISEVTAVKKQEDEIMRANPHSEPIKPKLLW